jgi:hypothetical protein
MARPKRKHSHFDVAVTRCAALQAIDPQLDLGFGLTVPNYQAAISEFLVKLNAYNTALSLLDAQARALADEERALQKLSTRMLSSTAGRYGRDSTEYQKAGGSNQNGRKKAVKGAPPEDK